MNLLAQLDLGNAVKLGTTYAPGGVNGAVPLGGTLKNSFSSVSSFINLLLPLSFIIAGLIFLFILIGGGFSIIVSGGNAKNVESGKNQIMGALIGFILIFASYWIIQIVEAFTGVKIFNPGL